MSRSHPLPAGSPSRRGRRAALAASLFFAGALVAWFAFGLFAPAARAQVIGGGIISRPPGVYIDTEGTVKCREVDATQDLADMRNRARAAEAAVKKEKLAFVSLPKLFAKVRTLREANKDVPDDLRYPGGLTQIRYVFVYPQEKDLIIAGPAEPWMESADKLYAWGKTSGRPVLQLDDLIAAFRTAQAGGGRVFGCAINPSPDSVKKAEEVAQKMATATRADRVAALRDALGPQQVQIFGTAPDTRFAFVCVAADYELKRFGMGLHRSPVPGLGNSVDNSRSAANKFWFDPNYEPLLVSADGNAYAVRGQRLGVKAGGFDFDPRGATPHAVAWAKQFSQSIPALAKSVPLIAELQNVADEALLANLVRKDKLDQKAGWDTSWLLDERACPVKKVPVPRTTDTLVTATNGSLVCGGVVLEIGSVVIEKNREVDQTKELEGVKKEALLSLSPVFRGEGRGEGQK